MLKNIHFIKPHLFHLLLLSSFLVRIKASAVLSPPIRSGTVTLVEHALLASRNAHTSTFDDPTAPPAPPASHDETSTFSIVSNRETIPASPPPEEEWHLILEENASFLPAQNAALVLEAFYKGVKTIMAQYTGNNNKLRLLFGELELMFSPLARIQAVVTRELVNIWVEYMLETVAMGDPAEYSGWMMYGPDVRVRVDLRVRPQVGVGVGGTGEGW